MEYRIAVLDDDLSELHNTENMLADYQREHPEHSFNVSCYTEAATFMNEVCTDEDKTEWAYDILLMDIYLPDGNGIKCGRILRDKGFAGVISYKSSTEDNCLDAFAVDAMQYLIKPVSEEKLFETLDEAVIRVMTIEKIEAESLLYSDDSVINIQSKEAKRRKSIKEFLLNGLKIHK